MRDLETAIRAAFPWAFVSGCNEAGEGEVKAVHFLLHHHRMFRGRIVLLGGDSDLVLLGSAARPLANIYCVHSNSRAGGRDSQRRKNKRGGGGRRSRYTCVAIQDVWKIAAPLTREELCIAAVLMGNDYLPRIGGATMRDLLKKAPQVQRCGGIVNQHINLKAAGLVQLLSGLKERVGKHDAHIDSDKTCTCSTGNDGQRCSPEEYFRGLAWCFFMYATGTCPNVDYCYTSRGAPCIRHCRHYLESLGKNGVILPSRDPNAKPLSCNAALLLLIPRWGRRALPPHLLPPMDHPELAHWFPAPCDICDDFRVRRIEIQRRRKEVANMHFDNKEEEKTKNDEVVSESKTGLPRTCESHTLSLSRQ